MNKKLLLLIIGLTAFGSMGCFSPILTHAESPNNARPESAHESKSLADCDVIFKTQGLCASMDWVKYPNEGEVCAFTLRFWKVGQANASGPYLEPTFPVFVRLWMPSMGHGSSPVSISPSMDSNGLAIPGVYEVTQVFFVMRGQWEIQVQLKNKTQVVEQENFSILY
jgi:hypothetical protein